MVLALHDENDKVYAYMEWMVVGKDGNPKDGGEDLYISHLWIHKDYHLGEVVRKFTKMLDEHPLNKNIKNVYWQNLKHDERVSRILLRTRALVMFQEKGD